MTSVQYRSELSKLLYRLGFNDNGGTFISDINYIPLQGTITADVSELRTIKLSFSNEEDYIFFKRKANFEIIKHDEIIINDDFFHIVIHNYTAHKTNIIRLKALFKLNGFKEYDIICVIPRIKRNGTVSLFLPQYSSDGDVKYLTESGDLLTENVKITQTFLFYSDYLVLYTIPTNVIEKFKAKGQRFLIIKSFSKTRAELVK